MVQVDCGDLHVLVEKTIRDALSGAGPLKPIMDYLLSRKGKFLRPSLVIWSAAACGHTFCGDFPLERSQRISVSEVAAACELIHMASLVHDDVIDGASERRGLPTIHVLWGVHSAILSGDYLFARANALALKYSSLGIDRLLNKTVELMCQGEVFQDAHAYQLSVTEPEYFYQVSRKTAALMGAACKAGAILGTIVTPTSSEAPLEETDFQEATGKDLMDKDPVGKNLVGKDLVGANLRTSRGSLRERGVLPAIRRALWRYGVETGIAFQIVDDVLDVTSDGETLGKPVLNDLRSGTLTLPLIYAMQTDLRKEIERCFELRDVPMETAARLREKLWEYGCIKRALDVARSLLNSAESRLDVLEDCEGKQKLLDLARGVLTRVDGKLLSRAGSS